MKYENVFKPFHYLLNIMNKERLLIGKDKELREFLIKNTKSDFHSNFGSIKKEDLRKKDGSKILTNTGNEFYIISPFFIDKFKRIERGPQIPLLKDIGIIIAMTGIGKDSVVVDAGGGSGGLSCFLANIVKKVIVYEINKKNIEIIKRNKEFLGLKNLEIINKDICEGIDEMNVDLITLDLPEPWKAIDAAKKALRIGGFIASYSPTIIQAQQFSNEILKREELINIKTIELIERNWKIEGRIVRPEKTILHSGFLSFARRIK